MLSYVDIKVISKQAEYDLSLRRRITVLQGDSGSGKTLLRDLIIASKTTPAVKVQCELPVELPPASTYYKPSVWLSELPECVLVVDEDSVWIDNVEFYDEILNHPIWLVVITRSLDSIKAYYSIKEIYTLHVSGKYVTMRHKYNFQLEKMAYDVVVTEDRKSGRKLFQRISNNVVSADGNANVVNKILEQNGRVLAVIDGANYGRFYAMLYPLLGDNVQVLCPESIEEFMLRSTISIADETVSAAINSPEEYQANEYKTWENYYEAVIDIFCHKACGGKYDKSSLPKCLTERCCFMQKQCAYENYKVGDKIRDIFSNNEVEWIIDIGGKI